MIVFYLFIYSFRDCLAYCSICSSFFLSSKFVGEYSKILRGRQSLRMSIRELATKLL